MTLELDLPPEVAQALGEDPEREVLEAVLLLLVKEGKMTVGKAGEVLGFNRLDAIRWYTSHGFAYPDLQQGDLDEDFGYAQGL
jgi:hypothetical protein